MECYECERIIEVTAGMTEIPVFLYDRDCYHHEKIMVIECPNCEALIGIQNYVAVELHKEILVDKSLETP